MKKSKKDIESRLPRAKKSLGQNFLVNPHVAKLFASRIKVGANVLEVGPGTGVVTRQILSNPNTGRLIVVEKDNELAEGLKELNIKVINADALDLDFNEIAESFGSKITFISNLPYNVGTQILLNILAQIHLFSSIVIMLQEEVIQRIMAKPNTKSYGRLSVFCQLLCTIKKLASLSPGSFYPAPKVHSAMIEMLPLSEADRPTNTTLNFISNLCEACFSQRRKLLVSVLNKCGNIELVAFAQYLVHIAGLNPARLRIEDLSPLKLKELAEGFLASELTMLPVMDKGFNLSDIPNVAEQIIQIVQTNNIKYIFMEGKMGTGKTTLTREILIKFGTDANNISSPTYDVVHQHTCVAHKGRTFLHADLYRIKTKSELIGIGFEEMLADANICIIEWPELALDLVSGLVLIVKLYSTNDGRHILAKLERL